MKTLLIILSLFSAPAMAFTLLTGPQNQVTIGWDASSVTFDVDTSCAPYASKVNDAIETASNTWGAVPTSSLKIFRGSTVTLPNPITTYVGSGASQYAPVGNTIVYCDTNFGANSGEDANSIPGFASSQNYSSDGKIRGGLLVLNMQVGAAANVNTLDSTLVSVVLTHEIGHSIGFGHSRDTEALMYYNSGPGRLPVLTKDDIDAVTYLYPQQESGKSFLGCASVAGLYPPGTKRGGSALEFAKVVGPDLTLLIVFLILIHSLAAVRTRTRLTTAKL